MGSFPRAGRPPRSAPGSPPPQIAAVARAASSSSCPPRRGPSATAPRAAAFARCLCPSRHGATCWEEGEGACECRRLEGGQGLARLLRPGYVRGAHSAPGGERRFAGSSRVGGLWPVFAPSVPRLATISQLWPRLPRSNELQAKPRLGVVSGSRCLMPALSGLCGGARGRSAFLGDGLAFSSQTTNMTRGARSARAARRGRRQSGRRVGRSSRPAPALPSSPIPHEEEEEGGE